MGRILVVDDSVVNQRLSVALLKQRGYEVEAVGNGKEAVRVLCEEAKHYDVVLMDCHMPEMDGFEASAQVRAHDGPNRNNIIIALTGTLEETQMINCNNSGMNDYLDKPMKIDAFESSWKRCREELEPPEEKSKAEETSAQRAPFWDDKRLEKLRVTMGDDADTFIADMIEMFLEDVPNQLEAILGAIEARNASELRESAHRVKGASTNIGLVRVADVGLTLEDMGKTGELEGAVYWFKRLKGLTNQVRDKAREELGLDIPS